MFEAQHMAKGLARQVKVRVAFCEFAVCRNSGHTAGKSAEANDQTAKGTAADEDVANEAKASAPARTAAPAPEPSEAELLEVDSETAPLVPDE